MTSITIPNSITRIPGKVFQGCSSLISVTIPNSVTSIGYEAFYDCCSLTSVIIPDSVTSIDSYAFQGCTGLTSIIIPNSVISMGTWSFSGYSNLVSVTLPNSVTRIGLKAFYGCSSLTNLTIPSSVTSIDNYAFQGCTSLTSITIPDSVTSIDDYAFQGCTSLTSITIPDSVTNIGYKAFSDCCSLTSVIIPDSVISIGDAVFSGCTSLTSVTIPNSVTSIGSSAFYGCTSLTSITIPDSVISIGVATFSGCSSLTSVTIPNSVTDIKNSAFSSCSSLTSITIPSSVTNIGNSSFYGCSSLTSITIPDSVTSIGAGTFSGCSSLTGITIPSSITEIEAGGFRDCTSLTSITLPNSITSISRDVFQGCSNIISVIIPNSVTSIGGGAFDGCTSLTDVYYSGSRENWATIYFGSDNTNLTNATKHYNYNIEDHYSTISHLLGSTFKVGDAENACICYVSWAKNKTTGTVSWTSSNPSVFQLTGDTSEQFTIEQYTDMYGNSHSENIFSVRGNALSPGTSIITLKTDDGASAFFTVEVTENAADEETLAPLSLRIDAPYAGETGELYISGILGDDVYGDAINITISNADVCSFETGTSECLIVLPGEPLSKFSRSVILRGNSVGSVTITVELQNTGLKETRTVSIEDREEAEQRAEYLAQINKIENLAAYWDAAYYDYVDSVQDALLNEKNEIDQDPIKAAAEQFRKEEDRTSAKKRAILFEKKVAEDVKNAVYMAVIQMMSDSKAKDPRLGNITDDEWKNDVSIISMCTQLVNAVYKSLDTTPYTYRYGNIIITLEGLSYGKDQSVQSRRIYFKYADSSESPELIAYWGSNTEQVAKAANYLMQEMAKLEKNLVYKACEEIAKELCGKSFSEVSKDKLKDIFKNHSKAFLSSGAGQVTEVLNDCMGYYKEVKTIIKALNDNPIGAVLDVKKIEKFAKYEFTSKSVTDTAVDMTLKALRDTRDRLDTALLDYAQTGQVDMEKLGNNLWVDFKNWLKSEFKCPVSIDVYNSTGKLIGYIRENETWYDGDTCYIEVNGDVKTVYSRDTDVHFEVVGTDYGTLDCTFEEYVDGAALSRVNYFGIPLYNGKSISAEVPPNELNSDSIIVVANDEEIEIPADETLYADLYGKATVLITCKDPGECGTIYGTGTYVRGDAVKLLAAASDGYYFVGWVNQAGIVLSQSRIYEFTAQENISFTALFVEQTPSLESYSIEISEQYASMYDVNVTQDGDQFVIHMIGKDVMSSFDGITAWLAEYDNGMFMQIDKLACNITDVGIDFNGTVNNLGSKLFVLDKNFTPIIRAYTTA